MSDSIRSRSDPQGSVGAIVFIAAQLPPAVCGVGDYSMTLVRELKLEPPPCFLTMRGAAATRAAHPAMEVAELPMDSARLAENLAALDAATVVLEYVAHGFQPRGCPLWLLRGLWQWRRKTPGARLVIMFHELWFLCPWWKPDWLLQKRHRRAVRRLASIADQVFVSTEGYREWLADVVPGERLRVLPIGSNIVPPTDAGAAVREAGTWVVFGRQGSRVGALRAMAPWLAKLHGAGRLQTLIVAGSRDGDALAAEEDGLLAAALPAAAWQTLGPQSPAALSALFRRAEFGVLAQTAASYTKSGIFMAYAAHGLAIVAENAADFTTPPQCWVLHPAEVLEGKAPPEVVRERGGRLQEWHDRNANWPAIAAAYRGAIHAPDLR